MGGGEGRADLMGGEGRSGSARDGEGGGISRYAEEALAVRVSWMGRWLWSGVGVVKALLICRSGCGGGCGGTGGTGGAANGVRVDSDC